MWTLQLISSAFQTFFLIIHTTANTRGNVKSRVKIVSLFASPNAWWLPVLSESLDDDGEARSKKETLMSVKVEKGAEIGATYWRRRELFICWNILSVRYIYSFFDEPPSYTCIYCTNHFCIPASVKATAASTTHIRPSRLANNRTFFPSQNINGVLVLVAQIGRDHVWAFW